MSAESSAVTTPEQVLNMPGLEPVQLRLLQANDANAIYMMAQENPYLQDYVQWTRNLTPFGAGVLTAVWLEKLRSGELLPYQLVEDSASTEKLLGAVSLHSRQGEQADVDYYLAADQQGKGYATRATRRLIDYGFSNWGLTSVTLGIRDYNGPSIAVAQRLGARRTDKFSENGNETPLRNWIIEKAND